MTSDKKFKKKIKKMQDQVDYSRQWKTLSGQHYKKRKLNAYLNLLSKKDKKILDVGCADGLYTIELARKGLKMIGIDISSDYLKKARRETKKQDLSLQLVCADGGELPFKKDVFDAVFSMSTVIWMPNPSQAIKEFTRVVKPNGKVIADFSNKYCFYYIGLNKLIDILPTKIASCKGGKKFSSNEIKLMFKDAGLKNINTKNILLMHRSFPKWMFYLLKPIEKIMEKTPLLNRFLGVIVCEGIKPK